MMDGTNLNVLQTSRQMLRAFGGLNEGYGCSEAEFSGEMNFSSRGYPALQTRKMRRNVRTVQGVNGMYHLNGLLICRGKTLEYTPDEEARTGAVVLENVLTDDRKAMELAMIENLQREDLNPIEEAEGYRVLTEQYGMTQDECAQRVGKSRPTVANALRLLGLTEPVRAMVEDGRLSAGHARALLTLGSKQQQAAAETVVKDALSVRQTELLVKKLTAEKKEKPQKDALSVNYVEEAARELGEKLGRPCRIVNGKKKGRIELEYYGTEDLNALLEALEKLGKR